jgi:hypothetical protein
VAGVGDQVDNDLVADEGMTAPVLGDVAEYAIFNLVPLADAGREMTHANRHLQLIFKILHGDLPQLAPTTIAAAAISHDQQFGGVTIVGTSHFLPPPADGGCGELGDVVFDTHADPILVVGEVVHAVGNRLAQFLVEEVTHANFFGHSVRPPFSPSVLKISYQVLLLRVHGDHQLPLPLKPFNRSIDILELCITIGMRVALLRFMVALRTEINGSQQSTKGAGKNKVINFKVAA